MGVQSGIGYTDAAPPKVLIAPPTYVREENTIESYGGGLWYCHWSWDMFKHL